MTRTSRTRVVLGGPMNGQRVTIMHGSTMVCAGSGFRYRKHGISYWVPSSDSDEEASQRIREHLEQRN